MLDVDCAAVAAVVVIADAAVVARVMESQGPIDYCYKYY